MTRQLHHNMPSSFYCSNFIQNLQQNSMSVCLKSNMCYSTSMVCLREIHSTIPTSYKTCNKTVSQSVCLSVVLSVCLSYLTIYELLVLAMDTLFLLPWQPSPVTNLTTMWHFVARQLFWFSALDNPTVCVSQHIGSGWDMTLHTCCCDILESVTCLTICLVFSTYWTLRVNGRIALRDTGSRIQWPHKYGIRYQAYKLTWCGIGLRSFKIKANITMKRWYLGETY